MRQTLVLSVLALACGAAAADELGRVISSTPVVQQVGVPRQVCSSEPVLVQPQAKSGAGALVGAIAGGAMGNAVGGGSGRAAATVLGLIGGAMVGDRIEGGGQPYVQQTQQCTTQTFYENRTVAYNVVYEYAGKQYNVQMPSDPGPTVRLQITPVGASMPPPVQQGYMAPVVNETIYAEPAAVPVYPVYEPRPYYRTYPPIGVNLNFGYSRGHWR
jgi:uncharacterized protein YcfJ